MRLCVSRSSTAVRVPSSLNPLRHHFSSTAKFHRRYICYDPTFWSADISETWWLSMGACSCNASSSAKTRRKMWSIANMVRRCAKFRTKQNVPAPYVLSILGISVWQSTTQRMTSRYRLVSAPINANVSKSCKSFTRGSVVKRFDEKLTANAATSLDPWIVKGRRGQTDPSYWRENAYCPETNAQTVEFLYSLNIGSQ